MTQTDLLGERILVLAPVGRDASLTCEVLGGAGFRCKPCRDMAQLCNEIRNGAAALLLTQEALTPDSLNELRTALDSEPDWSDLPVVLFLNSPGRLPKALEELGLRKSVSAQERPVRRAALVSLMRVAVQARARQYQLRDLMLQLEDLNRNLEERVGERTAELESINRELEAFSYSISHDLRAPLRAIDGFSRLILEDHSDELEETARDYFERIRSATTRMGRLIDDLLKLSRVTSGELNVGSVDLSSIALSVATTLKEQQPQRHAEFGIDPGVSAQGDSSLLRIVLQNLMENAWKFTAREEKTNIRFGVRDQEGRRLFFLSDNGAGFDMRYADRLFTPFQRLHQGSEFGGTGIGLAIVKRIISRHGGEMWAESEREVGATFYFTLPERRKS